MKQLQSFQGRVIHLIGSLHSKADCVSVLKGHSPTHMFIETTREVLGLLRRKEPHSQRLVDLPALVQYADQSDIELVPVDTGLEDICGRVFGGLDSTEKFQLWKYVILRRFLSPIANFSFMITSKQPQHTLMDPFIARWALSEPLIKRYRRMVAENESEHDLRSMLEVTQDTSSFLSSPESDPSAFIDLCRRTNIDQRLDEVIIHYRNDFMSDRIRRTLNTLPDGSVCAVIVGRNHIKGIHDNLSKGPIYTPDTLQNSPKTTPSSFLDKILLASLLRYSRYKRIEYSTN
jgi:pheromone shutdown protein TraB